MHAQAMAAARLLLVACICWLACLFPRYDPVHGVLVRHAAGHTVEDFLRTEFNLPVVVVRQYLPGDPLVRRLLSVWSARNEGLPDED